MFMLPLFNVCVCVCCAWLGGCSHHYRRRYSRVHMARKISTSLKVKMVNEIQGRYRMPYTRARAHDAIGPSNLARSDRLLLLHYNI